MKIEATDLPGVLLISPKVFADERGWFLETWRRERYLEHGIGPDFVQGNASRSGRGVLRGLHYQWPQPQGKLVWVSAGRVLDVAVDIRPSSPTFKRWMALELDDQAHQQLWIPEGFAHGFQVLSGQATFHYLCTRPYRAEYDAAIAWNDPDIAVDWPLPPVGLSAKDAAAPRLVDLSGERLPS
ncbi:MAG: dTDP-4-dehydrorhamnose 3,5-epimerase [Wenzhouxiangella sp.]